MDSQRFKCEESLQDNNRELEEHLRRKMEDKLERKTGGGVKRATEGREGVCVNEMRG